ncbi:helix-turn-helix domain-containing protein, partial [Ectopseudomonas mendocina]|uniref:helix-turn-helix domain-containing protein n=1 Tax=Ectopseudomonas mendocina TaxID=300 RepID=UPI0028C4E963
PKKSRGTSRIVTDAITIQNPRNRGGSTGHVLAKRSVTFTEIRSLAQIDNLEDYLEDIERKLIMQALEETRWNRTAAAQRLGLTFRSMRYRLKKLGID